MDPSNTIIYIVDDDNAVNNSLEWLINSIGFSVKVFTDPESFLREFTESFRGCILLDVRMPKKSGLEIQHILNNRGIKTPIIFMTSHRDIHVAVQAMKAGAIDFLVKPFGEQQLLDLINRAINIDSKRIEREIQIRDFQNKLLALSKREKQVLNCVVRGMLNKHIAEKLFISNKTVEAHRARIMNKLGVKSLAELIKKVTIFNIVEERKAIEYDVEAS